MYYVIQCRFSELLFQLCIKNAFFLGPCRNITTMCRKIAFFLGPCRNITIQEPGGAGFSCRAIFGVCADIFIFGKIFTSALGHIFYWSPQSALFFLKCIIMVVEQRAHSFWKIWSPYGTSGWV